MITSLRPIHPLLALPTDVLKQICQKLSFQTAIALLTTSQDSLAAGNPIWRDLVERDFSRLYPLVSNSNGLAQRAWKNKKKLEFSDKLIQAAKLKIFQTPFLPHRLNWNCVYRQLRHSLFKEKKTIGLDYSVRCLQNLLNGGFVSFFENGRVKIFSATGNVVKNFGDSHSLTPPFLQLSDGRMLCQEHSETKLWRADGTLMQRFEIPFFCDNDNNTYDGVSSLLELPNGQIAIGSIGGLVVGKLEEQNWSLLEDGFAEGCGVASLTRLAGGWFASCSNIQDIIKIWNAGQKHTNPLAVLKGHTKQITAVVQLVDGRIASSSEDCTIRLWRINGDSTILQGHTGPITCLIKRSKQEIVSASEDGTLRIWNISDEKASKVLQAHSGPVTCLIALSGGRFASGYENGTLRIWNADGSLSEILKGHDLPISYLISLSDGTIVSASLDRNWHGLFKPLQKASDSETIKIWKPAPGSTKNLQKALKTVLYDRIHQIWLRTNGLLVFITIVIAAIATTKFW